MTTLSWNSNGFFCHLPELQLIISQYKPDFVCLQETHLRPEKTVAMKEYNIYRKDREDNTHGGVAILTHQNNYSSQITLNTNLEAVAVKVLYPEACTICSIYIPPDQNPQLAAIENLIQQLPAPYILTGDFNAYNVLWNYKNISYTNQRGKLIEQILDHATLLNNGAPTHFSAQYGTFSTIDLSLCDTKIAANLHWDVIPSLHGSDHFPVVITNLLKQLSPKPTTIKWDLKNANWPIFTSELDKVNITLTDEPNINLKIKHFEQTIIDISHNTIGAKKLPNNTRIVPWWNKKCQEAVKENNKALKKYKKQQTIDNLIELKKTKAIKRRIIKQSKTTSWQNFVSTINPDTPSKQIWENINKIKGKHILINTTTILKNGEIINKPEDIVNTLAKTFADISSDKQYTEQFLAIKSEAESTEINITNDNDHPLNIPFKIWELNATISKLKNNKSPGPDGIPYELIKHFSDGTKLELLNIFNHIWTTHTFPDSWREAIVIPILKPNKLQTEATNYRPIALSNTICKIMEKMVSNRLTWYLESNHLFSNYQCGFRAGRSTIDQLFKLQTEIQSAFDNKQHLIAIFFDLEKAYDTTWRYNILKTLTEDYKIDGNIMYFIKNFLTNRCFKVRSHGCLSDIQNQDNGVPQGATLSVVLFLIAINKIISCVSFPIKMSLFADDLVVYCKHKNIQNITTQLQNTLNNLQEWTEHTGFRFSPSKTKAVHFCRLRGAHIDPTLKLYGNNLQFTNSIKFLGLIFDKKLTWKTHINYLKSECHRRMNILKTLCSHHWGAHTDTLLTIYRMLIRSKLDYGCIIYNAAKPRLLKSLNVIQSTSLRLSI